MNINVTDQGADLWPDKVRLTMEAPSNTILKTLEALAIITDLPAKKWEVRKHQGQWFVRRSNDWWHDQYPTHQEAITAANFYASVDLIDNYYYPNP